MTKYTPISVKSKVVASQVMMRSEKIYIRIHPIKDNVPVEYKMSSRIASDDKGKEILINQDKLPIYINDTFTMEVDMVVEADVQGLYEYDILLYEKVPIINSTRKTIVNKRSLKVAYIGIDKPANAPK